MFSKFRSISADKIDIGHRMIINEKVYRVGATGANDTYTFLFLQRVDGQDDRILQLRLKNNEKMDILKK